MFPRREVSVKPIQMASRIWDQVLVSWALYILQSDIAKYSSLIWVEDDVLAFGIICHQSIAHKKRRNATAEANFKRNLRFHRLNSLVISPSSSSPPCGRGAEHYRSRPRQSACLDFV